MFPEILIGLTDPKGAVPFTYYTTGELVSGQGSSITEGIGQGRITGNMEGFTPDHCWEIDDVAALNALNELCIHEGLQLGLSSGINVAGAIEVAKKLGPGHTLVTILADGAMKYASKMYNPAFLHAKSLPVPFWLENQTSIVGDNTTSSKPYSEKLIHELLDFDLQELVEEAQKLPQ